MVITILKFVAIGILLSSMIFIGVFNSSKKRLISFCKESRQGYAVGAVKRKALDEGFKFITLSHTPPQYQKALVTSSAVMGRSVCEIEHDGYRVINAKMIAND